MTAASCRHEGASDSAAGGTGEVTAPPKRVKLAHVLIAFKGALPAVTRSKGDAEKLAADVLARARKGEKFEDLMKLSDDTGGGVYTLVLELADKRQDNFLRDEMVPAFGNVGFKLKVGEIGMANYDPMSSPYGWHIIKRVE
jgi:hypothetical protein